MAKKKPHASKKHKRAIAASLDLVPKLIEALRGDDEECIQLLHDELVTQQATLTGIPAALLRCGTQITIH